MNDPCYACCDKARGSYAGKRYCRECGMELAYGHIDITPAQLHSAGRVAARRESNPSQENAIRALEGD